MSKIEVNTIIGPAHWASYLINGDDSGLELREVAQCDAWLERENAGYVVSCSEEAYFTQSLSLHCPEAGFQAGEVLEYQCLKVVED